MEAVTLERLRSFLERLGERYPGQGTLYLLGGCALQLLGNPRTTVDVDYTLEFAELEHHFDAIFPEAAKADIIPDEFSGYFEEIRQRYEEGE